MADRCGRHGLALPCEDCAALERKRNAKCKQCSDTGRYIYRSRRAMKIMACPYCEAGKTSEVETWDSGKDGLFRRY